MSVVVYSPRLLLLYFYLLSLDEGNQGRVLYERLMAGNSNCSTYAVRLKI